jgi:hypothetical protein
MFVTCINMTLCKIHLKDIDDGALHFCILFIRTLSIVQFNKITTFQRLALSPSSGDKRERAKGEVILAGGSLDQWWRLALSKGPTSSDHLPFALSLLSPEDGDRASVWNVVILLNWTMDNVRINKIQKWLFVVYFVLHGMQHGKTRYGSQTVYRPWQNSVRSLMLFDILLIFRHVGNLAERSLKPKPPHTTVRFRVLTTMNMRITAFLHVAPCRLLQANMRFRCAYCLHHQGDESVSWRRK